MILLAQITLAQQSGDMWQKEHADQIDREHPQLKPTSCSADKHYEAIQKRAALACPTTYPGPHETPAQARSNDTTVHIFLPWC